MKLFLQSAYLSSLLSVIYITLLYRSNRHRRLPVAPLLAVFSVGMLAVVVAVLFYRLIPGLRPTGLVGAALIAPLVEEAVKLGLFSLTARRLGYPSLIEPLDYAIYYGILGVGFAIYEDFWYIFETSYPSWISGDAGRFFEVFRWMAYARSFPGHVLFDAIAGFLLGWAALSTTRRQRWGWTVGAFFVAFATHSVFNLAAAAHGTLLLWSVVTLYIGVFLAMRRKALETSPFSALRDLMEGKISSWTFAISPVDILFAEGFDWPGKPNSNRLAFYPLVLSLAVLFPILLSCVYLLHRALSIGGHV
jgi:RsiW-degrading membrane proteinase PrsW (M82 family)